MAFLTKIAHINCSLANGMFAINSCRQLKDHITICPPRTVARNTCSMRKDHFCYPLKPYESLTTLVNSIVAEEADNEVKHVNLVKSVGRLISKANDERFEDLIIVDALQRMQIDYHFEDEIKLILKRRYSQFIKMDSFNHQNLHEVSLCFRILRQNGFHVSADAFKKFMGNNNKFEENFGNVDIRGLMALYEASHLRVEGETVLDEAERFSYKYLSERILSFVEDEEVGRMVRQTLENPYHKTIPFFTCKNSIKDFNGTLLQELAQLDFDFMQTAHQMEVNQILRWWKELGLGQELIHARDQPLKWYLWSMIALTNPKLSTERIDLTKIISFIYIIDDIFDVYGNIDELTIFTQAIKRWDINAIEELPYYMTSTFKALYEITSEIANKVYEKHGFNPINSLWKSWETLCSAFLVEAKWFASGHIPNVEEYMKNATVTCGVQLLLVHMFFLLGDGTNEEHGSLINDNNGIILSVSTILRLWDDLGNARDENQDGHDGSYIKCFLNDHEGCSIKMAREHVINLISDSWKRLNKECFSPNPFSATFIKASINIVRMVPLMYSYDDNSELVLLNDYVKALLSESF